MKRSQDQKITAIGRIVCSCRDPSQKGTANGKINEKGATMLRGDITWGHHMRKYQGQTRGKGSGGNV